MKNLFLTILSLLCLTLTTNAQEKTALEFQQELNEHYSDAEKSPLTKEGLAEFKALPFFPINNDFKVTARLKKMSKEKVFKMKTTTDRKPKYIVYAVATFELNGKSFQLNIYKSYGPIKPEYRDYLFLPFTDATNGNDTYGGGRFIDLKITENDEIVIDFNQAYNPYCAYNHGYSCPIPPKENDLDIRIEAGVKYVDSH